MTKENVEWIRATDGNDCLRASSLISSSALWIAAGILVCLLLVSCGRPSDLTVQSQTKSISLPSVSISPQTAALAHSLPEAMSTVQFTAAVQNANPDLVWLVNGKQGGDDSIGRVSPTGLYTAPRSGQPAAVTVTAALASDPRYGASATVQLSCAVSVVLRTPDGSSVPVSGRLSIYSVATHSCNQGTKLVWAINGATGTPETGFVATTASPEWVLFYSPPAAPLAPVLISAAFPDYPVITGSVAVTVTPSAEQPFRILPSEAFLEIGRQQQFKAYRGSEEVPSTWLVNSTPVTDANSGWVRNGLYTAPFTIPKPTLVVVTAADNSTTPNRFASALVTITAPSGDPNARLHGTFAMLLQDRQYSSYLLGSIGFDGAGNVIGSGESGGLLTSQRTKVDITGTYRMDWDGHGVIHATIPQAPVLYRQQTWDLMFASEDYAEVDGVPGPGYGFIERQDLGSFSSETFPGTYVLSSGGVAFMGALGALHAEAGRLRGEQDGAAFPSTDPGKILGSYTIAPDGTGTAALERVGEWGVAWGPYDVSLVAISGNKYLFAGTSNNYQNTTIIAGLAERQSPAMGMTSLRGTYVFQETVMFAAFLGRFVADGTGLLTGVYDWGACAPYGGCSSGEDVPFTAAFSAPDEFGRVVVAPADPGSSTLPSSTILYLITPDKFTIASGSAGFTGYGYRQSLPPDSSEIAGRYALHGLLQGGQGPGWVLLELGQPAIGLPTYGEQPQPTFSFDWLPPNNVGKGLPNYYVVDTNKLMFMGGVLDRMRW